MKIEKVKKITISVGILLYLVSVAASLISQIKQVNGSSLSSLTPRDVVDLLTITSGFGFYFFAWKDSKIAIHCFLILYGVQMLSTNLADIVSLPLVAYNLTCLSSVLDGFIFAILVYPRVKTAEN